MENLTVDNRELHAVDEERLNQLMELLKQEYPDLDPYFVHMISLDQVMFEKGYTVDPEQAAELYNKAQEQMKINEFCFNVE
jgi:hypothetical protein